MIILLLVLAIGMGIACQWLMNIAWAGMLSTIARERFLETNRYFVLMLACLLLAILAQLANITVAVVILSGAGILSLGYGLHTIRKFSKTIGGAKGWHRVPPLFALIASVGLLSGCEERPAPELR